MGLFGSRRGRDDRVGLGGYPAGSGFTMPATPEPDREVEVGGLPARERCPRDSDWCDGEICKQYGIDCPNADKGAEMTS